MCGRYNITDSPAVHALLDELGIDIGPLPTRYNVAPTDPTLTLFKIDDNYHAKDMRWWLTPSWSDGPSQKFAMFNARSESIDTSKAYRGPFKRQRGIIPATSFIEWQKQGSQKQAFEIKPTEGIFLFAAIWDYWKNDEQEIYSCSMVTTPAVQAFEHIHHRQPVMLSLEESKAWMELEQDTNTLQLLMKPYLPTPLKLMPVKSTINNAKKKQTVEPDGGTEVID